MKYLGFVSLVVVLGCSSSSSKSGTGGGGAGGGGAGGAAAGACGTVADAGNTDGGIPEGGTTPDLTAGAVPVALEHIALPDAPQRLAVDPMRNILYVMLSSAGAGGIVAVDMTTGNVLGKLATSGGVGSAGPFDTIAVDVDQNLVFGARYPTITVFDGATRLSKSSIDLSSVAPPPGFAIYGMVADNLAHRLYAMLSGRVAVIDTSTATPSLLTTISGLSSLIITPGELQYKDVLAIDTQNHLLFVCGDGMGDATVTDDYTIDTTQNAVTGSQTIIDPFIGCAAGPGFAEIVMQHRIGLLEATGDIFLPYVHYYPGGHDTVASASAWASSVASNGYSYFNVSATVDACEGHRNVIYGYDFCGGQLVAQQPTAILDLDPSGGYHLAVMRTVPLTPGNGADVYGVQVFDANADGGGAAPAALVRVHLPQSVFAAPADAGACP